MNANPFKHETELEYTFADRAGVANAEATEIMLGYDINGAEPDVGIMGCWIDDYGFYYADGSDLCDDHRAQIEADTVWVRKQLDAACENADNDPDDDYYPEPEWERD